MKDNNITKSANQVPLHTDWHRYETPAVVRKHGRQFLERTWSNMEGHSHPSGFERVIRHYGAKASESNGITLAPCVRIDVASFKETLLAYRGRNEENDDDLSRRIQSQDHCPDAAAA